MARTRNVCLVGHSGSGKTALATAILGKAGKNTEAAFDQTPEEKRRGYSIDLAIGSGKWKETSLNLLVTPGLGEFAEEIYKAAAAADLAVLVVNAEKPVEVVTEQSWTVLERMGLPCIVFVNMMDKPEVDPDRVLAQLREGLGGKFWPLQIPLQGNSGIEGLVPLIDGQPGQGKAPADMEGRIKEMRAALLEEVATFDDSLVEKVLADEEITASEVSGALQRGVASRGLTPVLWGSVATGQGLDELMDHIVGLAPTVSPEGDALVQLFSMSLDPYLGRLAYGRIRAGSVSEGDALVNLRTREKLQVRDVLMFSGTKLEKARQGGAGDIVALAKLEDVQLGDTLSSDSDAEPLPEIPFPKPVFSRAVSPKAQADEEKLSTVMRDLATTKATLSFRRDPVTKEAIVSGMGDLQLDVISERLRNRYDVELEYRVPRIPYRETIRKEASAQYRHKKQTGGRGQFGEVHLRINPLARSEGFEFADETKGGVIPQQFIPGVEKGVREALVEGILAGYPVVDVRAAVYYGQYHPVDSSELSFKLAARNAFKQAAEQADPTLLEPIMQVAVSTPEAYTGDIISDLNSRRGRILGMGAEAGRTLIRAEIPLAEVTSYALDLKSLTQGRATYQMEFERYDYVPGHIQERVIAQAKAGGDED